VRPPPETVILRSGCLWRQKLMQSVLVVGNYFAEQAGVGLIQEVVERRQISRTEATTFASAQERVHMLTVGGGNKALPGAGRVERPADNR